MIDMGGESGGRGIGLGNKGDDRGWDGTKEGCGCCKVGGRAAKDRKGEYGRAACLQLNLVGTTFFLPEHIIHCIATRSVLTLYQIEKKRYAQKIRTQYPG